MNRLFDILSADPRKYVYLPLKIYWSLIFILTSIPGHSLPKIEGLSDKVEHFLAYSGLAVLVFLALYFKKKYNLEKIIIFSFVIVVFYGGFDELHQMLIPFRSAEWLDFLADAIGAAIGIFIVYFFVKFSLKETL